MIPVEDLLAQATAIKNETVENNNSASRVGAWMEEVIPHLQEIANKADSGGSTNTLKAVEGGIDLLAGDLNSLSSSNSKKLDKRSVLSTDINGAISYLNLASIYNFTGGVGATVLKTPFNKTTNGFVVLKFNIFEFNSTTKLTINQRLTVSFYVTTANSGEILGLKANTSGSKFINSISLVYDGVNWRVMLNDTTDLHPFRHVILSEVETSYVVSQSDIINGFSFTNETDISTWEAIHKTALVSNYEIEQIATKESIENVNNKNRVQPNYGTINRWLGSFELVKSTSLMVNTKEQLLLYPDAVTYDYVDANPIFGYGGRALSVTVPETGGQIWYAIPHNFIKDDELFKVDKKINYNIELYSPTAGIASISISKVVGATHTVIFSKTVNITIGVNKINISAILEDGIDVAMLKLQNIAGTTSLTLGRINAFGGTNSTALDFVSDKKVAGYQGIVNVTNMFKLGNGLYYNLQSAVGIIPIQIRKTGLEITFETSQGVWETWKYTGAVVANWDILTNWKQKPDTVQAFNIANYAIPTEVRKVFNSLNTLLSTKQTPINLLFLGDSITSFQTAIKEGEVLDPTDKPIHMHCRNTFTNRIWEILNPNALTYDLKDRRYGGNMTFISANHSTAVRTGTWNIREAAYSGVVSGNRTVYYSSTQGNNITFPIKAGAKGMALVSHLGSTLSQVVNIYLDNVLIKTVSLAIPSAQTVRFDHVFAAPLAADGIIKVENGDGKETNMWGIEYWTGACVRPINNGLAGNKTSSYLGATNHAEHVTKANPDVIVWQANLLNDSSVTIETAKGYYKQKIEEIQADNIPLLVLVTHCAIDANGVTIDPTKDASIDDPATRPQYYTPYARELMKLCSRYSVPYINVYQCLVDKYKVMPSNLFLDGIHLNVNGQNEYRYLIDKCLIGDY